MNVNDKILCRNEFGIPMILFQVLTNITEMCSNNISHDNSGTHPPTQTLIPDFLLAQAVVADPKYRVPNAKIWGHAG